MNLRVVLLVVVTINSPAISTAQSNVDFCSGWNAGYKEGWCYGQGYGCPTPAMPPCPVMRLGESTYLDGYNRGLITGREAKGRSQNGSGNSDEIQWEGLRGEPMQVPSSVPPNYGNQNSNVQKVEWKHTPGYSSLYVTYDFFNSIPGLQYHKQMHKISENLGILIELGYGGGGEMDTTDFYLNTGFSWKIGSQRKNYFSPFAAFTVHEFTYPGFYNDNSDTKLGYSIGLMYRLNKPTFQIYYDSVRGNFVFGVGFVF
jgi:hypothetical protein